MVQKIQQIAKSTLAICVGDLNSTPDTEQVKSLQALLGDAYQLTQRPAYGPAGTFNGALSLMRCCSTLSTTFL